MSNSDDVKSLLKVLTETVASHDTKLALDYQSIQQLDKDTDKMAVSVNNLTATVAEMAGAMKTQSNMMNAVLAVTVLAFLGVAVKSATEFSGKPKVDEVAREFVSLMQKEINYQRQVQVDASVAHKRAKIP